MPNQIPEQAVDRKRESRTINRRLPWYKRDPDDWDADTLGMDLELEGFYNRCLNAIWRLAGTLPADIAKIALLTRCHVRSVRRLLPKLVALGKLVRTLGGYTSAPMTAEIAAATKTTKRCLPPPPPPERQLSFDDLVADESNSMSFSETKNPEVSTRALDPDPESEKKESPLPPDPPPPPERVHRLVLEGLGRGGIVSIDARRKIAATLAIGNPDPLVALYDAWPRSQAARDPDGLFIAVAQKLYRDAPPEVRQACQPIGVLDAEPPRCAPARASAALIASLNRGRRHDRHAR